MIELGKIVGAWGVKGWIKLHSYTRSRDDIGAYKTWYLQAQKAVPDSNQVENTTAYEVINCRQQGQGLVAQLVNVDDRNLAEQLIGNKILVPASDMPDLADGDYYWHQLIGLRVENQAQTIGTIKTIMETGANDVLVCENVEQGKEDVLIPYTASAVLAVDLEKKIMTVDWDPAFLE